MNRFRNLTEQQEQVFEQIAINNDGGHSFLTVDQLVELGLVEKYVEGDGYFRIIRYRVPLPVFGEWCKWCAEQPEVVEEASGSR